ncbi:MAG: HEAT repeat domain-containing protein [Anaerolineae bacterium]|nr:HEAT repeat domain-containing protein [Anaerolineae bacterium]
MRQRTHGREWTFEEALALICDPGQPLSRAIISFLSGSGRAEVRQFAECWQQLSIERRRELIATMVEMAEADFQLDFNGIFRWALQSEDPQVRERAIEGLWEDDSPGLIEPLLRLMHTDPEPAVRARAASLLGHFALLGELGDIPEERTSRLREGLLETIENPREDTEVRRRAIESVAYLSSAPVREIIDRAYEDRDSRMRQSAVFAMGRTADPHWEEPIRRELHSADPAMRYEAARAAGEIALRPVLGEVIGLLKDPDPEVRQMAVWALGQIGGPQARRALETCQASPDEAMRDAAEEALAELDFSSMPLDMLYVEAESNDSTASAHEEEEEA